MQDSLFNTNHVTPKRRDSDSLAYGSGLNNADADTRLGEWLGVVEAADAEREQDEYWSEKLRQEWAERLTSDDYVPSDGELDAIMKSGPCTVMTGDGIAVYHSVTRKPLTGKEKLPYCMVPEYCEAVIAGCKQAIADEILKIHNLTS